MKPSIKNEYLLSVESVIHGKGYDIVQNYRHNTSERENCGVVFSQNKYFIAALNGIYFELVCVVEGIGVMIHVPISDLNAVGLSVSLKLAARYSEKRSSLNVQSASIDLYKLEERRDARIFEYIAATRPRGPSKLSFRIKAPKQLR